MDAAKFVEIKGTLWQFKKKAANVLTLFPLSGRSTSPLLQSEQALRWTQSTEFGERKVM